MRENKSISRIEGDELVFGCDVPDWISLKGESECRAKVNSFVKESSRNTTNYFIEGGLIVTVDDKTDEIVYWGVNLAKI